MAGDAKARGILERENWNAERRRLRDLILEAGLEETVKWGKLCYTLDGGNVIIIYAMKNFCALGFFKGALLEDESGRLVPPGAHSQAMRQLRFTSLKEIEEQESEIRRLIDRARQAEADGPRIAFTEKDALDHPDELRAALDGDAAFAEAFDALTPGRRRGSVLRFSDAKQSGTRLRRIEKARPKILAGKGPVDR